MAEGHSQMTDKIEGSKGKHIKWMGVAHPFCVCPFIKHESAVYE